MNCIHLCPVYPEIFPLSLITKPLNTQNEWIILTLIRAVAGFCLVSLDVKQNTQTKAMNQSSVQRNPYCYSWHEANIRGLQVRN